MYVRNNVYLRLMKEGFYVNILLFLFLLLLFQLQHLQT